MITIPAAPRVQLVTGYDPASTGCTGCGTQATVSLDSRFGRRCADCPPWLALADEGRFSDAFALLRVWLAGGWPR